MRNATCFVLLVVLPACVGPMVRQADAQEARLWDFEGGTVERWFLPNAKSGVIAEPDNTKNHVLRIVATRPHHTRLVLRDSASQPDFIASCRFRITESTGTPPTIYLYGRAGTEGFRGLSVSRNRARAFCWFGQDKKNPALGRTLIGSVTDGGWHRAKLLCYRNALAAKVWPDGASEPPTWQLSGTYPGQECGQFALGVWLSPRNPSTAKVLFDDLVFEPIGKDDVDELHLRLKPRPDFDAAQCKVKHGVFSTKKLMGLASAKTIFAFDRNTGEIAHVIDRATGRDFVSPIEFRPLLRMRLTQPHKGQACRGGSDGFRKIDVHKASDTTLRIRFDDHYALPITASVDARLRDDGMIGLRLRIENARPWVVAEVRFPGMAWRHTLGERGEDDHLLLPWLGGAILPDPTSRSHARNAHYPGLSFAQFTAFYDETAGIYLAAGDPNGHCKRWDLGVQQGDHVALNLTHLQPEIGGHALELPYEMVVGTFHGDWREAAAIYKRWATRQPWCAKTLAERDDIPGFLKRGAGIIITGIANEAGRIKRFGQDMERLPDVLREYKDRTGLATMVFIPYGWENRGTWAGINYLPAQPSNEVWSRISGVLRKQDDRLAFLTSGYWWVVKRQRTSNGPAFDDSEDFARRRAMVAHRPDGEPWLVDNYEKLRDHGSWRGLSATLCHGSPQAQQTMKDIFLGIARLGVPLISFDQEIGGGQRYPCYRQEHGHPPGYGKWMWETFRDTCIEILNEGKPIQPELGLFLENTSELAIPYMATYWSRQFGEVDVSLPGARGIGLFSYLYHEYVTAIGAACVQGQGARSTRPSAGLRCRVLANNLTRGLIPGPFMHHVPLEPSNDWEKQVSRAYFSYCRPYKLFPEYLLLGITCPPPEIDCERTSVSFYRYDSKGQPIRRGGPKVSKAFLDIPAVSAGSFQTKDGSIATILANVTDQPQTARIGLPEDTDRAVLYRSDRTEVWSWSRPSEGTRIDVSLEPFGTRMLIVR